MGKANSRDTNHYVTSNDNNAQEICLKDSVSLTYSPGHSISLSDSTQISLCAEGNCMTAEKILLPRQKFFVCAILLLVFTSLEYFECSFICGFAHITNVVSICRLTPLIIKSFNLIRKEYE